MNTVSLGLLIASALLFVLNFAMGETILANLIVLVASFGAAASAFFLSAVGLGQTESKGRPLAIMACSAVILVAIFLLAYTDSIPMGYGP